MARGGRCTARVGEPESGGCGIRTREGVNPTRFPSVRHRPLGESSAAEITGCEPAIPNRLTSRLPASRPRAIIGACRSRTYASPVYASFSRRGVAPSVEEIGSSAGLGVEEVREALTQLAAERHLVLGLDGQILMAHPFAAIPLGFSVMGATTLWWGGCAWDSFALPHLLTWEDELLVATRCPACGAPLAWSVGRSCPPVGRQVAHFLVPAAHMWDDVVHTCRHQRIFCSRDCVDHWLDQTSQTLGVCDGPTSALAVRVAVVRRAPRAGLPATRPRHRGRVHEGVGVERVLLGAVTPRRGVSALA